MPLFDVAIVKYPTKKAKDEGASETLAWGPKTVVAPDEQAAGIVGAGLAKLDDFDPERHKVIVRPF